MLYFITIALLAFIPLVAPTAYCTYHLYNAGDSLTTVACSDGANGIMTKMGYTTLAPMYPYVAAFSGATWNSPNCGKCVQLSNPTQGNSVYITVVDQCGAPGAGYDAHFDIAPAAFQQLFGTAGVNAGSAPASWQFVSSSFCQGNIGSGSPPVTPVTPSTPSTPSGSASNRCGVSWTDANSRCGTPCTTTDAPCNAGEHCYASLAPCSGNAIGDSELVDSFAEDNGVVEYDAAVADESFAVDESVAFEDVQEFNDAAVADEFMEDAIFEDAALEAVADESFAIGDESFAAVGDESVAFEDAINVNDAAVGGELIDNGAVESYDAAVGDATSTSTQNQAPQMQAWMVAVLVLFSVVIVLLIAVIVQLVPVLRRM